VTQFEAQLRSAGMSATESGVKSAILAKLVSELRGLHGASLGRLCVVFVPGRVELAGKHTDYAGGRSLTCAIERGICLIGAPRADAQICIRDLGRGSEARFTFDPDAEPARGGWSNYAITLARRVARDFPAARTGADIVFASDLPRASGMSSSSALIVAVFFALAEVNSLWASDFFRCSIHSRTDLSGYLAAIESGGDFDTSSGNRGVGTLGGSEDHVAILCSRPAFLRQYSYCPIRFERDVRVPENHVLVIGVSGVKAAKTGNALDSYNRASLAARKIFELWRSATKRDDASLAAALASGPEALGRLRKILSESAEPGFGSDVLLRRLTHFAEESNEIVPAVGRALASGDLERAAVLMDRSQQLAETLLGNQTPETIELARSARSLGAAAASAFGAGFGGSVWALVSSARAEEFRDAWAARYRERYPDRAGQSEFLITNAGPSLIQFQSSFSTLGKEH
jgi:galactokinase